MDWKYEKNYLNKQTKYDHRNKIFENWGKKLTEKDDQTSRN